jgi:hypothetical protein
MDLLIGQLTDGIETLSLNPGHLSGGIPITKITNKPNSYWDCFPDFT